MAVPPWVRYKTKEGKNVCKFALLNDCFVDGLECDRIAAENTNFFSLSDPEKIKLLKTYSGQKEINKPENIKRSPGRPKKPKEELKEYKKLEYLRSKNAKDFKPEIIENIKNDIFPSDLDKQKELYTSSIKSVYSDYIQNNPQKVLQHPSKWKNDLFCHIKNAVPRPNPDNIELLDYLWSVYKDLCFSIGCTVTVEGFSIMTGIFYKTFKDWEHLYKSSPKHMNFLKNIVADAESMLLDDVAQSPITRGGSIFLLKARYGYTETSVVTHVSTVQTEKTLLDIPTFNAIEGDN